MGARETHESLVMLPEIQFLFPAPAGGGVIAAREFDSVLFKCN